MKKILNNNKKTIDYLEKLPKIYLVCLWAHTGVREFPFSGKYEINEKGIHIPLVYDYDDHNGTCDNWFLRPITSTTTGYIIFWTQSKWAAETSAELIRKNEEKVFKHIF